MLRLSIWSLAFFQPRWAECARMESDAMMEVDDTTPVVPGPTSVENAVAMVYHAEGIYLLNRDGGFAKVGKALARVSNALPIGNGEALTTVALGMYRTQLSMTLSHTKVGQGTWIKGGPTLRTQSEPSKPIIFHDLGPCQVDASTGECTVLSSDKWVLARAICYSPDDAAHAVIFDDAGLYRVDLNSWTSIQLGTEGWRLTKAVVYDPLKKVALAFHNHGLFRVNLDTGAYEKLGDGRWADVKGAVYSHDRFALVVHDWAVYRVNMDDGSWTTLSSDGWGRTQLVMPLGDGALFSVHSWCDDAGQNPKQCGLPKALGF